MSGVVETITIFKTDAEIKAEGDLILATANYSDFLTQQDMKYLQDLIRAYTHTRQVVTHQTYINIMNTLLVLAEHKYMLDMETIEMLKGENDIYKIHVTIDRDIKSKLVESANYSRIFTPEQISQLEQLDTYTLGIELRNALLVNPYYGQQLPIQVRSYLETIDPYIVLAFIDKLFSFSAEGIDIVLQPISNVFGFLHNGDYHPLYKMVIELYLIGELTNDDKSSKRQTRLNFLLECIKFPDFVNLYYSMYTYLNCIQEDQTIALIVSGGNLVTLFAKLLYDISSKTSIESLIVEYRDILDMFLKKYPDPRYSDIKSLLAELNIHISSNTKLRELIPIVQAMLFGDLDFKLIKVTTMVDYNFTDIETLYNHFHSRASSKGVSTDAQFFLGRKKIIPYKGQLQPEIRRKLRTYRKQYEGWLKQSCYSVVEKHGKGEVLKGKLDREILGNIFPSQMQDKYLHILLALRDTQTDLDTIKYINNCYKYLSFMSCRKAMNELGTRENINKISAQGDPSQFIKALRYYTCKGNTYIVHIPKLRVGVFTTFNYVMTHNSGFLPKLVASLLNLFLTDTEVHPDFVLGHNPKKLEESKVTYDYSKTKDYKSYEAIMVACKAIINLEDKRGRHFVFLGLDAKNETAPNLLIDKFKNIKKSGIPTSSKTIKKSNKSTKTLSDYVSSLLRTRSQIIPSINIDIEPDDSVYEFSDNTLLPENVFDSDNQFLPESLLDDAFPDSEFLDGILGPPMPESSESLMLESLEYPIDTRYMLNFEEHPQAMSYGGNKTKKSRKHKTKKSKKSRKSRKHKKVNKSKTKKARKQSHYKSLFGKTVKRHTKTI